MRITKDEYYLSVARSVALRSTCLRRQYGAVIVNNSEIVSTGYNGSARGEINCCDKGYCQREIDGSSHNDGNYGNCPAVHSEMNAIISASRVEMIGATLYLFGLENGEVVKNCKPCPVCERMIKNAGISKVVTVDNAE